jgi:hypothetical protein
MGGLVPTVSALAVSADGTKLFAGIYPGVFLSTNNGANWTAVNTGLTNTSVRALAVSATNLFAGTDGGVFLSTDNGTSWTAVNTGLTNTSVKALAVSGTKLYAGTDGGVFLSTDNGTSWTAVNTGLTNTSVLSLAPDLSGNLFAGTSGGGIFSALESALPVELTTFTAALNNSAVELNWQTATEVNNYGFDVERRLVNSQSPTINNWGKIGFVGGSGTSNSAHSYSYADASVSSGTFAYRLKQIDNGGAFKYSQEAEVTVSVPKVFALNQNYPNPFNPTTEIGYSIEKAGMVSLKVYNMLGQEVATLVNGPQEAGIYTVSFNTSKGTLGLSSGVYLYRLEAGSFISTKKLVLMK